MTEKMKKLRIGTALLLTMLIVALLPLQVTAEAFVPEENPEAVQMNEEKSEAQILTEIIEERDTYTKHFLLNDGTRMAVQYEYPVHYQDKDSNWIEYDNRMIETETQPVTELYTEEIQAPTEIAALGNTSAPAVENVTSALDNASLLTTGNSDVSDEIEYQNKKSDIDIRLSSKAKTNNMVKVKADGYQISWGYGNVAKSKVEFVENKEKLEGNDKFLTLKNTVQEAQYKDVYKNVDLQYFITPQGVKENLVIKDKSAQSAFEIKYKAKGLTAVQKDDQTIALQNKDGKTVYTITAPYMKDADGNESSSVTITLKDQKNGKFTVEVSADKEWLNAWGRKFPVTVDPEISVGTVAGSTTSAYTSSLQPSIPTKQKTVIYVGQQGTALGVCKGLIKLNQLPELNEGDRVVDAKLNLTAALGYKGSNMLINAHNITCAWNNATAKEDNITFDSNVIDYGIFNGADSSKFGIDITKSMKGWYDGTLDNNGILLESSSTDAYVAFGGHGYSQSSERPMFTIIYKNFIGTEPTLSYHTVSTDEKTVANVSDYLGSLIIQQTILQNTGSRMPVSITAVYNSILYNDTFNNNSPGGYGWQFSFNRFVKETKDSLKNAGYDYIFTDEDGTNHYFKLKDDSTAEWEDEDNLGYSLTKDQNYMYLKTDSNITQKYALPSDGGCILTESDQYNNTITYAYNTENNLYKITDGSGRIYTINYSTNIDTNKKRISSIVAPDGKTVRFVFSTVANDRDRLTAINYSDNTGPTFTYFDNGRLACIKQADNYKTYFYYTKDRINKISENGTDDTEGNYINITYGSDNTTTFIDRQGRKEVYTFNDSGENISVLNDEGYIINTQSDNVTNNGSGAEAFTKNYLKSGNEGTSSNYSKKEWNNGNSSTFTFDRSTEKVDDENVQYLGKTSFKVEQKSEADFTTFYQSISASDLSGKAITFSAYLKTNSVKNSGKNTGVLVRARYLNSSGGQISVEDSTYYTGTNKWKRINASFSVPSNAATIEIHCGIKNTTGRVWFDCLQLEEGECMNDYNAIENGDFSRSDSWQGSKTLVGSPTLKKSLPQNIVINKKKIAFIISGVISGNSVPLRDDRKFGIKLKINYDDTTIPSEEFYQAFNPSTVQKQAVNMAIHPQNGNKLIKDVVFSFVNEYNSGTLVAYNAMVNISDYEATYFDENETTPNTLENNLLDDDFSDIEPYQGEVKEYDSYGNTTKSTRGTVLTDIQGNESIDTSKPHLSNITAYNSTNNYVSSNTDSRGKTVNYDMNPDNGLLNSFSDANGNKTTYTYNNGNNVTSVSGEETTSGISRNNYEYNNANNLTSISHNGFAYKFTYDAFRNKKSSTVAGNALVTNSYADNNGTLTKTVYGNHDEITYTYDKYDRITSINSCGEPMAKYIYNKKGYLAKAIDFESNITTEYEYDIWNKLINKITTGKENSTKIQNTYDEEENCVERLNIMGDVKTITHTADENGKRIVDNDGCQVNISTDELNRTETIKAVSPKSGLSSYTANFSYYPGSTNNKTTDSVQNLVNKYGDNVLSQFSYVYDNNGNIIEIKENGIRVETYAYDQNNQLTYAASSKTGTFTFYSYDNAGNITNVTVRALVVNGWYPSTQLRSIDYNYSTTGWKDKLVGYDGQSITYDEIGNPLSYRDNMKMTWKNGKQLAELTANNETYVFKYNADGLRTSKYIKDSPSGFDYYYDNDNRLTALSDDYGNIMQFYYDEDGNVISMRYKNQIYFYVKNLQGDIVKIIKDNGNVIANYTYDAWGKLLSVKDAAGIEISDISHVANINPLRYRGYVFDSESNLYCTQNRYYDPVIGRFINADIYCDTMRSPLSTNMFAYCENNSIMNVDSSGKFIQVPKYVSQMLMNLYRYLYVSRELSERNYEYNDQEPFYFTTYLNGQGDGVLSLLKVGKYRTSKVGCGWIATFNAIKLMSAGIRGARLVQPKDIIWHYERTSVMLQAEFGIPMWSIADYLHFIGYKVRILYLPQGVDAIIKLYKACIVGYQHSKGGHYVAIQYRSQNRKYYIYNYNDSRKSAKPVNSVDQEYKYSGKFKFYWCVIAVGNPLK